MRKSAVSAGEPSLSPKGVGINREGVSLNSTSRVLVGRSVVSVGEPSLSPEDREGFCPSEKYVSRTCEKVGRLCGRAEPEELLKSLRGTPRQSATSFSTPNRVLRPVAHRLRSVQQQTLLFGAWTSPKPPYSRRG